MSHSVEFKMILIMKHNWVTRDSFFRWYGPHLKQKQVDISVNYRSITHPNVALVRWRDKMCSIRLIPGNFDPIVPGYHLAITGVDYFVGWHIDSHVWHVPTYQWVATSHIIPINSSHQMSPMSSLLTTTTTHLLPEWIWRGQSILTIDTIKLHGMREIRLRSQITKFEKNYWPLS